MAMAMGEAAPGAITAREKKQKDNSSSVNKPPATPTPIISVEPPRGTRDFPPEDMRLRSWLFNNFREVSSRRTHVQRGELPAAASGWGLRKIREHFHFFSSLTLRYCHQVHCQELIHILAHDNHQNVQMVCGWLNLPIGFLSVINGSDV